MALFKCIYGLKQASRRWFEKLRGILTNAGYKSTTSDPCLYVRQRKGEYTLISVVVDDLLIASNLEAKADRVIGELRKAGLETKDLGFPEFTIGMHIARNKVGDIEISQKLYLETILNRFGMGKCNSVDTPADPNVKLGTAHQPKTAKEKVAMESRPYRSLVGALLYMTLTRPDISVAVNECCRYVSCPGAAMWTAGKRILRYLKRTAHYTLKLSATGDDAETDLKCFVDASHADDSDTRRSRCGWVIMHGGNLVAWKTTLQKRVALSTAEAEYRAATLATKVVVWMRRLLGEVGFPQTSPTPMYEDNEACVKMVENPIVSKRNKHIELDCHYIRQEYKLGSIRMVRVGTTDQRADLMTKNLPRPAFVRHTCALMSTDSMPP